MKNVSYISAGAGSGKTYTLTEKLASLIEKGKARPEQVVLTTFTIKAAEEFKERSKQKLFEHGLYNEAALLDNALIGTIHSVANSFISKYWFFLGLSPHIAIMAEDDADLYRRQSLSSLATKEEIRRLRDFAREFNIVVERDGRPTKIIDEDFWRGPLADIISYSTNYEIMDYTESIRRSTEFFRQFVNRSLPPLPGREELGSLMERLREILSTEKQSKASEERKEKLKELGKNARRPTVAFYAALGAFIAKLPKGTRKLEPGLDRYEAVCSAVWQTPAVFGLVEGYIGLMFRLAERWREQFAEFKRVHSLLDFNDLEKYFLRLLEIPESASEIGKEYRYVFVDEFQDCSPIQVKIFGRLSELVEHSYWVGDTKQAIYGFRGSDTQLTDAIVEIIEKGEGENCDISTLGTSYRSVPGVVGFCNRLFTEVFEGILSPEKICLAHNRKVRPGEEPLVIWPECTREKIADHLGAMIGKGVAPADIAVLDRTSSAATELAELCRLRGIPVNMENVPLAGSKVCRLAAALLSIADNDANTLAKAEVAFLLTPGMDTERLISETLMSTDEEGNPDHSFLDRIPIVERLRSIRGRLKHQSIGALAESLFLELNLFEEAGKCAPHREAFDVLITIIRQSESYEERCTRLNIVPTVSGFVNFILDKENGIMLPGDPEGVQLLTMHASKGLQWKNVVVTSLRRDPSDMEDCLKKDVFGTHYRRTARPSAHELYPEVYITLLPFIYGGSKSKVPSPMNGQITNTDRFRVILENKIFEESRLLYVALTRAADRLILADDGKRGFRWFEAAGAPDYADPMWLGDHCGFIFDNDVSDGVYGPGISAEPEEEELTTFPTALHVTSYLRRDYSPSLLSGTRGVRSAVDFRYRIPLGTLPEDMDESDLGNCVHHIFRLYENGNPADDRIKSVIGAHGLLLTLTDIPALRRAWDNLLAELTRRHGALGRHMHERPFILYHEGKVFTGCMDLTVETSEGLVLVDFKSCPMGNDKILDPENKHFAGHYGAQLECYARALRMAGTPPVAMYLYYPVSGLLVETE